MEYFVFLWWPFPKSTQTLVHDIDIKIRSNYIGNFTREFLPIIIDRIESPRFTFLVRIGLSWTESSSSSLLTTPLKIPMSKISSPETDETCNCFELCALIQCNFCVFGTAMADFQIVTISADFSSISADSTYITFIFGFLLAAILAQEVASQRTVDPAHVALHTDRLTVPPVPSTAPFLYEVAKNLYVKPTENFFSSDVNNEILVDRT